MGGTEGIHLRRKKRARKKQTGSAIVERYNWNYRPRDKQERSVWSPKLAAATIKHQEAGDLGQGNGARGLRKTIDKIAAPKREARRRVRLKLVKKDTGMTGEEVTRHRTGGRAGKACTICKGQSPRA